MVGFAATATIVARGAPSSEWSGAGNHGLYRHVRNPMYVAVVALILGQGLMWADASVLSYGGVVWLISPS